jgi:hypothetical protein
MVDFLGLSLEMQRDILDHALDARGLRCGLRLRLVNSMSLLARQSALPLMSWAMLTFD